MWAEATPAEATLADVRNAAWNALGIAYNADAAFVRFARANGLGNPVTGEFDVGEKRVQGFTGGILYATIGRWADIRVLPW